MSKFSLLFMFTPILFVALVILPVGFAQRRAMSNDPERAREEASGKLQKEKLNSKNTQKAVLIPVSSKALSLTISPPLRDLPTPHRLRDPKAPFEVKGKARKSIGREGKTSGDSIDAALNTFIPSPRIPAPLTSFEGQSIFDTIALGQGFLPPDTVGDIGPNHYVQMVNSTFRIWNKAGVPQTPVRSLADIWASIPGPCASSDDGDPIVLYDSLADRWLLSQFCTVANPNNHQLIAISQTGDPTGAYYLYDFMMPNNKFNDYPKFGVWPDGYYMTDNQFNQAGTAFLGGGTFAFDRAKMLAGDPTASFIYFDLFQLDPSIGGMLPSDADGLTPPPAGAPNVFAYFIATEFGDASDGMRLFNFHADFAVPANSTFVERPESPIAVAAFNPSTPVGQDDIEQPPPANNATAALDAIGDRLMHRLQYRNFGTHESLITNHTVNVGTGNSQALHQAGVRYYELRRTGGSYSVNEQASFAPDFVNRWMGSAAMDHQGNLAVGYSVSDTTVFPGVRYGGRLAGDPPNGLFQGEAVLQAGGFVQTNTASRWGDYSSMNVDPVDDCTFWYTQEYYLDDQPGITAEWHTRFGSFRVNPSCTAPAQGTLQVNVSNCGTGLPVQGVTVSVNSNIYDSTEASGQSLSQLSPGSYSVLVSHAGYFPIAAVNANITNSNTTVVNVCLNGSPDIEPGGSSITAESISPANNAPDPGETITATFQLINVGIANTANLVASLQNSGGVTPVTTSANYGVVSTSGTPVSRPFTFVASGTCGNEITATLKLQDGATNLGTITYTFRLGTTTLTSQTFSNTTAIMIPATGTGVITGAPSTPYPSAITVAGLTNPVTKVTVALKQMTHTFPGDVDVLLVGPAGVKFTLMSDSIGNDDWTGQTYTFDDAAAVLLPSNGTAPPTGFFKPTNYGTGDAFPPPAPAAPYLAPATAGSATLGFALNGLNPNGTWNLYVVDDAGEDIGTFAGGWDLTIATTQSVCNTQVCTLTCPANIIVPADGGGVSAVVNYGSAPPTGACGVLNYNIPSGSAFPVGTTTVTATGSGGAMCSFTVTVTPGASTSGLIISEFRLRGLNGVNDEFIELYNNSGAAVTVSTSDDSAGWAVAASDGAARCLVPNGTVVPNRGHFLCVNSVAYSLGSYPAGNGTTATGDVTYTNEIPDNVGIALFNTANQANFTLANRLDAVGSTSEANTMYKEGPGYPALTNPPMSFSDFSLFRNMLTGLPQDTNSNSADFLYADTLATDRGLGRRLGGPGPENLSSPIQRNAAVKASLVFPCIGSPFDPNRVRDLTPIPVVAPLGTLELRRTFTNNTGAPVTRLRFRVVDITTTLAPPGTADLRVMTSNDLSIAAGGNPCGTGAIQLRGTSLETPPTPTFGGGLNTTLSSNIVTLGTPLEPGASINIRLLLGVNQGGTFRFYVNVEALP